jgi:hypothetical protein
MKPAPIQVINFQNYQNWFFLYLRRHLNVSVDLTPVQSPRRRQIVNTEMQAELRNMLVVAILKFVSVYKREGSRGRAPIAKPPGRSSGFS